MPPLLTHQKASQNDRRTPNVYFRVSNYKKTVTFPRKKPTSNFGPSLSNPHLSGAATFFCDFFFLTMFKVTWCFFIKKNIFRDIYVFWIQCFFFEIQTIVWEYSFSLYIKRLVRDANGWEGNGDRGREHFPTSGSRRVLL